MQPAVPLSCHTSVKPKQTSRHDMHVFNKHPVQQEVERTFEIQQKKIICSVKDKGKGHPRTAHESPEGEQRYSSVLSVNLALDRGGWSKPSPGRFTPGRETRYPWYRRLGGPQGRSGRVRKISSIPGFDPRTVQSVASHYTNWVIPADIISSVQYMSKRFNCFLPFSINLPRALLFPSRCQSYVPALQTVQFQTHGPHLCEHAETS